MEPISDKKDDDMHNETPVDLTSLADALKLPRNWLKAQADAGSLPALRAGNRTLYFVSHVKRAIFKLGANSAPRVTARKEPVDKTKLDLPEGAGAA